MSVFEAAKTGDLDALREADLAARQPPYGWTLLHVAAAHGQADAVRVLVERGLDVNVRDDGDNSCALHWAAMHGHDDTVRVLVESGADVIGEGDDHGLEVIGWATCWDACHEDVATLLLERGARHTIFSAVALGDADAVRELVAADPRALHSRMARVDENQLPLHVAARRSRPEIVALLVELGADPLGVDASGHDVSAYATTADADRAAMEAVHVLTQAELTSARRGKRAPLARPLDLIAALAVGDEAAAAELGVQPGALHVMAKRGDARAVRWLLDHGADINALWTHWGAEVTPLHLAAGQGQLEVIRTLLDAGADATIHDSVHDGDALGWAEHFGQAEAAKLLVPPPDEDNAMVVLEFSEEDEHLRELLDAFEDGWVVGIASRAGQVRLELDTPGDTWGAAVSLVERRLDRLPFDWRSHAVCVRP